MRLWTVLLSVSLALGVLGISGGGVVHASTLTVCSSGCSSTSITGAVQAATKGDTISIAPGTYHENVTIDRNLTLQGSTSGPVVIDGGGVHTTVTVNTGITAVLADLTVTDGGSNNGPGGGIENLGYLTVNRDAIVNNRVTSGYDTRYGGGIANDTNGQLTVINSTIAGNQAVDGGGLWSNGGGDLVFIVNSTIAGNVATYDGGGIGAPANTVYIQNAIVADNQQTNGSHFDIDCNTVLKSNGNNLLGSTNGCSLAGGSNDQQNVDPQLGPLQNNGGPSLTMAPAAISPVVGTGNLQACTTGSAGGVDQRGASRPVQSGALCDIGAVELQVYYVSVNGVDGAGCGSPTAPCRQIWTTIGMVPDYGAIVLLHIGNFTGEGLVISRHLSLYGYAGESITGTGSGSVVTITPSGTASIYGVTIQNGGNANGAGVHVYPGGTLTLDLSTITGNSLSGTSYDAAGLFNDGGTVRISDSTITSNTAGPAGVAGILNTGTMTIVRSAIVNNRAYGAPAGGIDNGGTLTLANSTVAGNIAQTAGGIQNDPTGALHLINDTIADNNAQERFGQSGQTQGGGILNQNSKGLDLTNTIVARNSADVGPDCASAGTVSLGHNLIGNSAACNFTSQSGDQQGVDAQLQGLAHNGGPTLTEAIASTSPAVHGGDNSVCAAGPINNVDQRDLPRPSPTSGVCDIGAFEVQGSGPTAARIGQFHAARRGNVVRFSWRVTNRTGLAGFNLMAGDRRLNARLIQVHASPRYRVQLQVMAGTRFQLQVVLRSGTTITVASA